MVRKKKTFKPKKPKKTKKEINKDKKNKRNKFRTKKLNNYQKLVRDNGEAIWVPNCDYNFKNMNTNSWFDFKYYIENSTYMFIDQNTISEFPESLYKCIKINLDLSNNSKDIIDRWFNATINMYNETIKYLKGEYILGNKPSLSYRTLRSGPLRKIKNIILLNSTNSNLNFKNTVYDHTLDAAIKFACASYKSAFSNYRNGNIKHFRIRYQRFNSKKKMFEVEKNQFSKGSIFRKLLEDGKCSYDGSPFNLDDILNIHQCACKMHFDREKNEYSLLVSTVVIPEKFINIKKNIISLDPGIRTFMTGITDDEVIKIGNNVSQRITNLIKKINRCNNIINKRKKSNLNINIVRKSEGSNNKTRKSSKLKKNIKRNSDKISNLVDDLHWKVSNHLVNNYETILIGDMSVKGIVNNKTSKLTKMTKRVALRMKFYEFRSRLEYKCMSNKVNYKVVDESYTSKVCSYCGNCKENLGSAKIYHCEKCGITMDRDINGARGILIKSLMN